MAGRPLRRARLAAEATRRRNPGGWRKDAQGFPTRKFGDVQVWVQASQTSGLRSKKIYVLVAGAPGTAYFNRTQLPGYWASAAAAKHAAEAMF